MGTLEEKDPKSVLVDRLLQNDGDDGALYTSDGSVDINGNPVLKHKTGNWKACYFILGTECCERLAFFSISTNLVTFLTAKLRQGNVSAAKNATVWQGTCYLTPIIGAAIADAGLGRYWTIVAFCALYVIGMCGLTLSATVPALGPKECTDGSFCPPTTSAQYWFFMSGLYLVALGTGGIKPCVSPFGADQFDDTDPKERAKKGSFFNWFYFSIYIGIIFASTIMVWVQENVGWSFGFGVPALAMAFAIAGFVSGTSLYRFRKPEGSPFTSISRVLVASIRNWNVEVPEDSRLLYDSGAVSCKLGHTPSLKFLDKAAVISDEQRRTNPWKLCSVTQVEEVKALIRLFPIWATGIVYGAVYAQVSTMFVEQGAMMDTRIAGGDFSIPPASVSTCDAIAVLISLPIYDAILVPLAKRFTGREKGFSELQRMGIGFAVSTLPVICAAAVETARLRLAGDLGLIDEKSPVPMSVLWQTPQYFLMGVSEVFAYVAQIEFFYEQSPDSTRSLCTAMMLSTLALGYYLNSFVLTVVTRLSTRGGRAGWIPDNLNRGRLDRFFWLLAGLSSLNFCVYVVCARRFKLKKASY